MGSAGATGASTNDVDRSAEAFVSLALQLATVKGHGDEVDSYFGPASLRPRSRTPPSLATVAADARRLVQQFQLAQARAPSARGARLLAQLLSFDGLLEVMDRPGRWPFEEEAQRVYGLTVPAVDQAATQRTLVALNAAVPGDDPLPERLARFYSDFVVPTPLRPRVFERALQECRRITLQHWKLPRAEHLEVQWTHAVPAAWHRYRGAYRSTLQINPDALALIGSSIDIACHEAYPGHHAQFVLQEQRAGSAGLPLEDRVVLLRSRASVLREGAANYGVELAFPFETRVAFDEHVLFPLAGLDPSQARRYETVHRLVDQLSAAAAPIIAAYRDRRLSSGEAASELAARAAISSPAALLQYADSYGAYVLGYTAVRDEVRDYVAARSQATRQDDWAVLRDLVSDPYGAPPLSGGGLHTTP